MLFVVFWLFPAVLQSSFSLLATSISLPLLASSHSSPFLHQGCLVWQNKAYNKNKRIPWEGSLAFLSVKCSNAWILQDLFLWFPQKLPLITTSITLNLFFNKIMKLPIIDKKKGWYKRHAGSNRQWEKEKSNSTLNQQIS